MELTVAKADLQKELQLCQGVVEKRSTIPILSNVLLKAADGKLQIAATDLDVTILSSCEAKVTTPGGVTIEARRLFGEGFRLLEGFEGIVAFERPERVVAINPTAGPQPAPLTERPELTTHPDPLADGLLAPHAGAIAPKSG